MKQELAKVTVRGLQMGLERLLPMRKKRAPIASARAWVLAAQPVSAPRYHPCRLSGKKRPIKPDEGRRRAAQRGPLQPMSECVSIVHRRPEAASAVCCYRAPKLMRQERSTSLGWTAGSAVAAPPTTL